MTVDEKKRRKAEKKAKKEKERLEIEGMTIDTSNNVDSSEEFQSESKLKKKKNKKDKDNKSSVSANFSNILEPDLQHLQTPKPKEKSSIAAPKTPKTPKDNFVLPSDFTVLEYKTEKSAWKVYQGPDGKNYRSMTEVKKFVESTTSNYDPQILAATIEYVATEWNCTEHGALAKDKHKFYDSEVSKEFPKSELYFP